MTVETSSVEAQRKLAGVDQFVNAISDADIRLLRIFCVVVASGGLSAATGELQADLSTVSRYVKELEDKVGARLCNRGRSGFSLTPQGLLVHAAAQELFQALKSFRENINTLHADPVGELKLGVMDALLSDPQFQLSAAMRAYRLKAPRVMLRLSVSKPNDIERQIQSGELDAGVVAARPRPPGLSYHTLYMERSSLYCSSLHPWFHKADADIHLGEASTLALVEDPYTESLPLRGFSGVFRKAATADSIEAALLLIRSGDYVGFLPEHYAAMWSQPLPLRAIRPDIFSYEQGIELVWRTGAMNSFVRALVAELGVSDADLAQAS
jgi:DNA-binding transcriptional LysR family regulator